MTMLAMTSGDSVSLRSVRLRIWRWTILGVLSLAVIAGLEAWIITPQMLDSLLGDSLLGAIAGKLILSILALMPPVAYIAIIVHTWHLADLLNRRLDWAAAAIGLPYVAPQVLTFLRALPVDP